MRFLRDCAPLFLTALVLIFALALSLRSFAYRDDDFFHDISFSQAAEQHKKHKIKQEEEDGDLAFANISLSQLETDAKEQHQAQKKLRSQ